MYYVDSETCGLCGPLVLLQYAKDDGEIQLYSPWTNPVYQTLEIIEEIISDEVCLFNASFDSFQICKLYTMFSMILDKDWIPEDHIDEIAIIEEKARFVDL